MVKMFLEYDIYLNINIYIHCLPLNDSKIGDFMNLGLSIFLPQKKMMYVYFYKDPLTLLLFQPLLLQ